MIPQNNYTLKHNSLTKSSSWRGAHWLLAYGKYGWPPYYSNKPKANEVWRFENSHCGSRAVSKHTQTKTVPPVLFPENLWENETLQLKPGDCQRGSTTNNFDIITLDVCLPPRIFISFAMISNNKLFHPDSRTLLAHIHKKFFFRGTWRLIEMAKWVLAEPTTDTVSAWDEVISSCRITLFSDIPWNSNTWLSIVGFTSFIHFLCTHYKFDEIVCQQWRQHDISRNRWGTKLKISSFQNFAFLDLYTH